MKKALGMMALGIGVGAGAYAMYDQYKSGNLSKMIKKAEKGVNKMVDNLN